MKVVICDDEKVFIELFRQNIVRLCEKYKMTLDVRVYSDEVQMLEEEEVDSRTIFFLDIEMPKLSGFEVAEELLGRNPEAAIIFVSNRSELVYRSFDYRPLYFIRKTHLDTELEEHLVKLYERCQKEDSIVTLKWGTKTMEICAEKVMYIESEKNYLNFYIDEQDKKEGERKKARMKIAKAEAEFSRYGLIRTHSGYLVNYRYIRNAEATVLTLVNDKIIPISRSREEEVRKKLMEVAAHV